MPTCLPSIMISFTRKLVLPDRMKIFRKSYRYSHLPSEANLLFSSIRMQFTRYLFCRVETPYST
jgi:hypothetical protein